MVKPYKGKREQSENFKGNTGTHSPLWETLNYIQFLDWMIFDLVLALDQMD